MKTIPVIKLIPPLLFDGHIKQKITCIRAHRERIFNVSMQQIDTQYIFHNYGQGGAGWTFLFGCVNESIIQFEELIKHSPHLKNQPIGVIGAGCYGLLTASMLAQRGHSVRIIAKELENIPSYKAAGFFFPRWRKSSSDQEKEIFLARGMESYETYLQIAGRTHPFIKTGTRIVPAYFGPDIDPGFAPYIKNNLIDPAKQVVIDFGSGKQYQMNQYHLIFMDAVPLMQELHQNVTELQIPIIKKEITLWTDIPESIIFNCSGWGAKQLTQDPRLVPVQGHLISLQDQPKNLEYLINIKVVIPNPKGGLRDELIYFAPKDEGILGITFIRNQADANTNQHEFDRLLQRCLDFFGT